jgi:hypothetical protein
MQVVAGNAAKSSWIPARTALGRNDDEWIVKDGQHVAGKPRDWLRPDFPRSESN